MVNPQLVADALHAQHAEADKERSEAEVRLYGREVRLTPEHVLGVGRRMLVKVMQDEHRDHLNVQMSPEDIESVSRVLQCPHCDRSIVEYGAESLPTRHARPLPETIAEMVSAKGMLVPSPCNHHGGRVYDPIRDLRFYV